MAARHRLHRLFQIGIDIRIVQDCLGMDTDVVVDDELQPRQTHTGIGQLAEVEGQLRVANVHHDLDRDLRHRAALDLLDLGLEQAVINEPGIALGTADRHQHALLEHVGRVTATDHGRNAEFARDDGGVAGAATAVGHDGGRAFHHRLPVRVGHVGHQHIARLHLVHLRQVVHQAHRASADFLSDGPAFDQHRAFALELVAVLGFAGTLAFHRLGARLQDVELAVLTVLAPLDVHGAAVVLLDYQRITRQFLDIGIGQRIPIAHFDRHVGGLDQLALLLLFGLAGELHLDQLGAQAAPHDGHLARAQDGLVHIELVRIDSALHHRLAQTVAGSDEHQILKS